MSISFKQKVEMFVTKYENTSYSESTAFIVKFDLNEYIKSCVEEVFIEENDIPYDLNFNWDFTIRFQVFEKTNKIKKVFIDNLKFFIEGDCCEN